MGDATAVPPARAGGRGRRRARRPHPPTHRRHPHLAALTDRTGPTRTGRNQPRGRSLTRRLDTRRMYAVTRKLGDSPSGADSPRRMRDSPSRKWGLAVTETGTRRVRRGCLRRLGAWRSLGLGMPSLELLLGIAAGVVLVGVVAVRVSVRLGLPSLLLYLGIGMVLGRVGAGHRVLRRRAHRVARARGARPHPGRGRAHHQLARACALRSASASRCRRCRCWSASAVVGAALHLLLGLEWRTALLWGAVLSSHRRRRGVQRAARRRGQQAALRRAGAGVRHERRAGRARRRAALLVDEPFTWLTPAPGRRTSWSRAR